MLSLLRRSARMLVAQSEDVKLTEKFIKDIIGGTKQEINTAFEKAGENCTILFIVEKDKEVIHFRDVINTFVLNMDSDEVLSNIYNNRKYCYINSCRVCPRTIVMKVMGDIEKIIDEVKRDHPGEINDLFNILDEAKVGGTVISFTEKPLNNNISLKDLYKKSLYVEENYRNLYRDLRKHSLKYLNQGLKNMDWCELEIRVYDRYGKYDLHLDRMIKIIENLELGIILGESWGKDYPRFLMSIEIYRIRFFTMYKPEYIKKILLGLEYLKDGTRIADYDVYYNRKKMYWTDYTEKDAKTREKLGMKYRNEAMTKLEEDTLAQIKAIEDKIILSRV